jgi:hypothetical protein
VLNLALTLPPVPVAEAGARHGRQGLMRGDLPTPDLLAAPGGLRAAS